MDFTLQQLFDGEIFPAEQYYPKIEKIKKIREEHNNNNQEFLKELNSLNPALVDKFHNILEDQMDTAPFECFQMFADGFRLGAKIVIEVFSE